MEARLQSDMKVPSRPAPPLPGGQNRKSRPSQGDLLSLGSDPFSVKSVKFNGEGAKEGMKRKPPPRPPPPRCKPQTSNKGPTNLLDIFGRNKDTSRNKAAATAIVKPLPPVTGGSVVTIDSLIDFHSPCSSPTFTKSNSSAFSVNSVGGFTTQNYNANSQSESGFEDDFISSTATTPSNDPFSDCLDPFSPITLGSTDPFCEINNDDKKISYQRQKNSSKTAASGRGKVKPSRPPPPKKLDSRKLSNSNNSANIFTSSKESVNLDMVNCSPPMPTIPPPPPPPEVVQTLLTGPRVPPRPNTKKPSPKETNNAKKPYCIAEYSYEGALPEDLSFHVGDVISLISQVNSDWYKGKLMGQEGIFPANYVKIMVPLSKQEDTPLNMTVITLFPFNAETWDDLNFQEGEEIKVLRRVNEDWLYGECNGRKGQFPETFVQDITPLITSNAL